MIASKMLNHRLKGVHMCLGNRYPHTKQPEASQPVHMAEKQEQQVGSKPRILCRPILAKFFIRCLLDIVARVRPPFSTNFFLCEPPVDFLNLHKFLDLHDLTSY